VKAKLTFQYEIQDYLHYTGSTKDGDITTVLDFDSDYAEESIIQVFGFFVKFLKDLDFDPEFIFQSMNAYIDAVKESLEEDKLKKLEEDEIIKLKESKDEDSIGFQLDKEEAENDLE